MDLCTKIPGDLSVEELQQVIRLITLGGQNTPENILPKMSMAALIAFFKEEGQIISTAAIKMPTLENRQSIFERAKSPCDFGDFIYETGFWATAQQHRGKGLFLSLLDLSLHSFQNENIFTIVHHPSAIDLLCFKYNFQRSGIPFPSRYNGTLFYLLVKHKNKHESIPYS